MNMEHVKTMFYLYMIWFGALFCRGLQSTAPATKTEPEAFEVLRLPHGIIMSKIKHDDRFTKRDFRPFRNVVQVHQILRLREKWPPKPPLILTHVTPANVLATSRKYQKVPRRPCGWTSVRRKTTCQTSKCPEMPCLPHEMAIAHSSKNEHGALVKRDLWQRPNRIPHFASLSSRNADEHLTRELLCENLQWKSSAPDGASRSTSPGP